MKLTLKLSSLALILFVLYGYNKNQTGEIVGKYFDIEEDNATHYIDFKTDGTYFHYYKKETIVRQHTGHFKKSYDKIYLDNWEDYSYDYLKKISGFGQVPFGRKLGDHLLYIYGAYLNTLPNNFITIGSYIKEANLGPIVAKRKAALKELEEFKKRKDTVYYPGTKKIKGIGLHCNGYYMPDDREHDLWKYYYETGELESEGNYSVGTKIGVWKYYYKNGKLKELGTHWAEYKIGTWEYYYENGQLKDIGQYIMISKDYFTKKPGWFQKSVKRGVWKEYDQKGNLIREKKFPSREKSLDSLFSSKEYHNTKKEGIEARKKEIIDNDKYYLEYKASLEKK